MQVRKGYEFEGDHNAPFTKGMAMPLPATIPHSPKPWLSGPFPLYLSVGISLI